MKPAFTQGRNTSISLRAGSPLKPRVNLGPLLNPVQPNLPANMQDFGVSVQETAPVNEADTSTPDQGSLGIQSTQSLRRSERIRNQALKAEASRKQREERIKAEQERTKARSIAAKKAAQTKRKAQQFDEASASGREKRSKYPKKIVKLRYGNPVSPPKFTPVNLEKYNTTPSLFWLRANVREFLLRFDKLCRLPTRFTSSINDLLQPWVAEQFKPVIISLLKLIANDKKPLLPTVKNYITEIDALSPHDEHIWDWLLEFVEQLDAFAPRGVPTTEEEQLDLIRRLTVICTGTETIRITISTDSDQLKYVEKDTQDEIKQIQAKFKETQGKLAKLKSVDPQVYADRLATGQRSADNKIWKAQQQLFTKLHKYNTRTSPVATDILGNRYWSLQYKSAAQTAWGSWIICEMNYDPKELFQWFEKFSSDISRILDTRDKLISEKANQRKKARKEKQEEKKQEEKKQEELKQEELKQEELKQEEPKQEEPKQEGLSFEQQQIISQAATSNIPQVVLPTTAPVMPFPAPTTAPTSAPAVAPFFQPMAAPVSVPLVVSVPPTTPISSSGTGSVQFSLKSSYTETPVKRRFPKLQIDFPQPFPETRLYYVEGRENIYQLANWVQAFRDGKDRVNTSDINDIAEFLSQ